LKILEINLKQKKNYMTPSLANFLGSIFWATFLVIVPITIALILVSRIDRIERIED
jgi:hypothetical protein